MDQDSPATTGPRLRRELKIWEAVGISLALMAPSMAVNINPQASAGTVGRAVPLAFGLATIGVLLIAWTFVRLSERFHHAGSVYGFVGATLGARPGLVAGWSLLGTYTFYGVVTSTAAGIFGATFLDSLGIWTHQPAWSGFLIGGIALAGVWALAVSPVRRGTRLLLVIEGVTVALILIVSVIILIKLANGTAPGGHRIDMSVFSIPSDTGPSAIFLSVVFGFLSFAGFEAAATLGEEAREPKRDIPRAILGTALFGGVYFVFVTAVEMMGFGTGANGVQSFIASGSLLGDLGQQYVADWIGDAITIGAAVSAFGCALASVVGASRLLYAMARDGISFGWFNHISTTLGTPTRATAGVFLGIYAVIGLSWFVLGIKPFDLFVATGAIGTLILLVAYALATVGAAKLLFFNGERQVAAWEVIVPALALALLGYTLFRNVWPYPTGQGAWYPIVAIAWLVLGIAWVLARPAATRRAGELLTQDEGLTAATATSAGARVPVATETGR